MVEIIPKSTEKIPLWREILFYLSIILLLITISSYFILDHRLKNSEKVLANLRERLALEKTAEEIALEKEISSWQKKIEDFGKLIREHIFSSNFYTFLERVCHPQVFFSKSELIPANGKAILDGQAENFIVLSQQISILKSKKEIKNLNLSKVEIGKEGKINFTLNLSLDPILFK